MNDLLREDQELAGDGLFDLADFEARNCETGAYDAESFSGGHRRLRSEYGGHPTHGPELDYLGRELIDFLYRRLYRP